MINDDFHTSLKELFIQHTNGDIQVTEFCEKILSRLTNDPELLSHSKKVAYYSTMLFSKVKARFNLTEDNRKSLFLAALLHDVGKLHVPQEIIFKTTSLTEEEFREIKNHTIYSFQVLSDYHFLRPLLMIIRNHHERFDGHGYPDGLNGQTIPVLSRVIAVADAFDAMTSIRPYKKALSLEWTLKELSHNSGTQFDPVITESMVELCEMKRISIGWEF